MGISRRDFIRLGAGAGAGLLYASSAMAPVRLFADAHILPAEPQGPPAPPRHYLLHKAFGDPHSSGWRVDSFDQLGEQIDLELRLLRLPSDKALFVDRKSGEVIEEYEHSGAHREAWRAREARDPELARAYTLAVTGKMDDRIAVATGRKKGDVIGRVGYSDVLAQGVERIAPWAGYLKQIAECNGIDPMLPIIIALQETNWSPTLTSNKSCHGVFQLNERNAENYGLHMPGNRYDINESYNPMAQALVAVPFIKSRIPLAGNAVISTSFYHAGENNVLKMMAVALLKDPSLADRPADAFAWVVNNYDHPLNTGGFSGFGYVSSRYPLRVLAMKQAVELPDLLPGEIKRMAMVEARAGMRAHDILKRYFGMDEEGKAEFRELNPHMPVRKGRIVDATIPAGVSVCLPLDAGDDFVKRNGGSAIRFDGTIDPLPGCEPWTEADERYAALAALRAERIDGVPDAGIIAIYSEMVELERQYRTPFRRHQRLTLDLDLDLYKREGRQIYASVAQGRGLPLTERQIEKIAEARKPRRKSGRKRKA